MIRFQNVLNRSLQGVLKTSSKRLEDLLKMSWRCLENVLKMPWRRFCKTSWRRLKTFWRCLGKASWRRLENVWRIYSSWSRRLEDILNTSSEDEDERHLQEAIKTSLSRQMFAGLPPNQKVVGSTKEIRKKERNRKKRNTYAIKWNKRWGANKYQEMIPFIVLKCNKERVHEIFPEAATGCAL